MLKAAALSTCHMTGTEACPIAAMPARTSTLVYPGGSTRCMFSNSGPYFFQVIPGDPKNLLIYFQGGGACWNKYITYMHSVLCTTEAEAEDGVGLINIADPANPFRNYTIVIAVYCSGDIFGGNVTQTYNDPKGVPVQQVGYYNTKAVIDWAVANLGGSTLENLILGGSSAGSLGVQLWSQKVLRSFHYQSAAVLLDSFVGAFPPGMMGGIYKTFGICGEGMWRDLFPLAPEALYAACASESLELKDLTRLAIASFPNVSFTSINSKTDLVQILFYQALLLSDWQLPTMTGVKFYKETTEILESWNELPNFGTYLVSASQHIYFNREVFSTTGTTGTDAATGEGGRPLLAQWLGNYSWPQLPVQSECDGEVLSYWDWIRQTDTDWCPNTMVSKFIMS